MATETVFPWPLHHPVWPDHALTLPPGCICPPTSEQTCESPTCPRKNPFKENKVP